MAEAEFDRAARHAINLVTQRPMLALLDDEPAPRNVVGTGTLVRRGAGTVILTAAHVGDVKVTKFLHAASNRTMLLERAAVARASRGDVAIVSAPVLEELAEFALSSDHIAADDFFPIERGDQLVVSGFPAYLSHELADWCEERGVQAPYVDVSHFTTARGASRDSVSIRWDDVELSDEHRALGARIGVGDKKFPLRKPEGISGAAIWKLRTVPRGKLWSVTDALRLVAIAHEFSNRRLLGVPLPVWQRWFNTL